MEANDTWQMDERIFALVASRIVCTINGTAFYLAVIDYSLVGGLGR